MNCENCGAPMRVYGDRDYSFCEYCGSFHFPAESTDGIKVLGLAEDNVSCPGCHSQLFDASIDGCRGLHCSQCKGLLIDQSSFLTIVEYRRALAQGPPARPTPLSRDHLQRQIRCPRCGEIMDTHPYYGPGNIVIDRCSQCRVIWLDHGELGTIIDAPGRDRGIAAG
jgi:Zn-finger nucleic acid-binding protein